jgi:hypothetical protein
MTSSRETLKAVQPFSQDTKARPQSDLDSVPSLTSSSYIVQQPWPLGLPSNKSQCSNDDTLAKAAKE